MTSNARRLAPLLASSLLLCTMAACSPGVMKYRTLCPAPASDVMLARELFAYGDSNDFTPDQRKKLGRTVVVMGDSVALCLTLHEYPEVVALEVGAFNLRNDPWAISPSAFVLLDGARTMQRQIAPHEAANMAVAHLNAIPAYQPKYIYDANTTISGSISTQYYGNYAQSHLNANARTTVTRREDPWNALGWSIGAALAEAENNKLQDFAGALYTWGLVEDTQVVGRSNLQGLVYWLNNKEKLYPLILRIPTINYEFAVQQCEVQRRRAR